LTTIPDSGSPPGPLRQPPGARRFRAERSAAGAALALLVAVSWTALVRIDWSMRSTHTSGLPMPRADPWGAADLALIAAMWLVMMIAMMAPSVLPALRVHHQVLRTRDPLDRGEAGTLAFLAGYLLAWSAFAIVASVGQWWLHQHLIVSSAMVIVKPAVAGSLLLAAGAYQFTSLKNACLQRCRAPLAFLIQHWSDGPRGALGMGLRLGAQCVGCCWLLMLLLFVFGVMDLAWIAALSAVVLAEKLLPDRRPFQHALGAILIAYGAYLIAA
jgi:predicted metal-binding membrane protein